MHADTKKELITGALGMVGTLAKEAVTRRQESQRLSHQLEMHKELADARSQNEAHREQVKQERKAAEQTARDRSSPSESSSPDPGGVDFGALIRSTDCSMCQQILREIQEMPPSKRAQGLAEYGAMKRAMESEGTEEAVRDAIDSGEVLSEVTQRLA